MVNSFVRNLWRLRILWTLPNDLEFSLVVLVATQWPHLCLTCYLWLSDRVLSSKSTSFTQQKHEHCQQTWNLQGDFRNVVSQLPVVSTNAFENCPGLWLPFDYKYKSFMKTFPHRNMLFVLAWVCLHAMDAHVWHTVLVSYFLWIESCGIFIFAFVFSSTIIAKPHGMILMLLK